MDIFSYSAICQSHTNINISSDITWLVICAKHNKIWLNTFWVVRYDHNFAENTNVIRETIKHLGAEVESNLDNWNAVG